MDSVIIDDLVKSQKSEGTVIPPWRDRWTFYEAVIIDMTRSLYIAKDLMRQDEWIQT